MALTVADIYSQADRLKRRVKDIASNPLESLLQTVGYGQQRLGEFNQLNEIALQGDLARVRGQQPTAEQVAAENKVRDIWASAYNPMGITVYHGSPYLFRRFDPSKMGTGEGAQAYGAGAGYTAEAKAVGEGYRNRLSDWNAPYTYEYQGQTFHDPHLFNDRTFDPVSHALRLTYHQGKRQAQSIAKQGLEAAKKGEPYALEMGGVDYYQKMLDAANTINKKDIKASQGFLYEGDIPDELLPKFLDWDKPLSQQTPEIKQALFASYKNSQKQLEHAKNWKAPEWSDHPKGTKYEDAINAGTIYNDLVNEYGSAEAVSKKLQEMGIMGIRYLDQGSRGAGKGTSNFIPFRPQDFDIRKINDIPIEQWEAQGAFK